MWLKIVFILLPKLFLLEKNEMPLIHSDDSMWLKNVFILLPKLFQIIYKLFFLEKNEMPFTHSYNTMILCG